jgi:two-component system, response regulator, stage 0 sporulation protein F
VNTKRVLVVDDEPEVTLALQVFFLGKGYEMRTALDGLQAMQLLRQHPVDLVLLDMKMPGVDGVEVLKFIRTEIPQTRVIVVTAYDLQFQEIVEKIGVDGFLMKPFGIQALTQKVERVLSGEESSHWTVPEMPLMAEGGRCPRARLLFFEPSEYTYKVKEVFFADSDKSGGRYEVQGATSVAEALEKLETFRPDILLVDLTLLGQVSDFTLQVMRSEVRPKEIILHGYGSSLSPSQNLKVQDLSQIGVKVIQNESFTRAGLMRLAEVVQKTALTHALVGE